MRLALPPGDLVMMRRQLLNLKALAYTETPIDLAEGAQHDERFLAVNPNGAVPALV